MVLLKTSRQLAIGVAAGALMLAGQATLAQENNGSVQGVLNDAYGQPVAGAFVKLKNEARRLTFMVITKERGQFEAKDLPPGTYSVQGVGGEFQSSWFTDVKVVGGDSAKV